MQKIGIEVGDLLRPHRAGMARYTECLLAALLQQQHEAEIHGWAPWRRLLGGVAYARNFKLRFFGKRLPNTPPDIFHATACVFPPWKSRTEIATVHDLYGVPPFDKMDEQTRSRIDYIQRADRIICVSHFTRDHLHELLKIPADRTVAIPLAAGAGFVPASDDKKRELRDRYRLPREFYLFVGRDRVNKNLGGLVSAYAQSRSELPLCIAGRQSSGSRDRLNQLAADARCKGSIRWLGELGDAELPILLSCASALCMPSTFEGFGLPVIEAMACGTPVLTSAGCATEEAAGGHAVLIDPKSVDSMADGLVRVLQVSEIQRAAAQKYATHRTWDDVATDTFRVYESHGIDVISAARTA